MRNTHYRTLNMSRKLTNKENEKIMVEPGIWQETYFTPFVPEIWPINTGKS